MERNEEWKEELRKQGLGYGDVRLYPFIKKLLEEKDKIIKFYQAINSKPPSQIELEKIIELQRVDLQKAKEALEKIAYHKDCSERSMAASDCGKQMLADALEALATLKWEK